MHSHAGLGHHRIIEQKHVLSLELAPLHVCQPDESRFLSLNLTLRTIQLTNYRASLSAGFQSGHNAQRRYSVRGAQLVEQQH